MKNCFPVLYIKISVFCENLLAEKKKITLSISFPFTKQSFLLCVFWDGWLSDVTAENAIIVSIFLCVFFSSFLNSEVILRTKQFI